MAEGVRTVAEGMDQEVRAGLERMFPKEFADRFAVTPDKTSGEIKIPLGADRTSAIANRNNGNLKGKGWFLPSVPGGKWKIEIDDTKHPVLVCEKVEG